MKELLISGLIFMHIFANQAALACPADTTRSKKTFRNSIDFCPLSPFINIYAVHYSRRITPRSELVISPSYMNIHYNNIGYTDAWGGIIGYRYYLWNKLHLDYQLMPMLDHFYETNEKHRYSGFDLWNELRLGYVWDFHIGKLPVFLNFQWPFGFALYSEKKGKPESFRNYAARNPFFYFPPLFFTGVRF